MKKYVCSVLIMAIFTIGFTASDKSEKTESFSSPTEQEAISMSITGSRDIDVVKRSISGTVWTYTSLYDNPVGFWYRLVFDENTCSLYYALPENGKWTLDYSSSYYVEEKRLYDGNKYVFVYLKYSRDGTEDIHPIGINITEGSFICGALGAIGHIDERDYEWD